MTFPEWLGLKYNITISEFYDLPEEQQALLEYYYREVGKNGDNYY